MRAQSRGQPFDPFQQRMRGPTDLAGYRTDRAERDGCSPSWSSTIRTARSCTSGENLFVVWLVMAPSYLDIGAPGRPGAVQHQLSPAGHQAVTYPRSSGPRSVQGEASQLHLSRTIRRPPSPTQLRRLNFHHDRGRYSDPTLSARSSGLSGARSRRGKAHARNLDRRLLNTYRSPSSETFPTGKSAYIRGRMTGYHVFL